MSIWGNPVMIGSSGGVAVGTVYGFSINSGASDPSDAIIYLADAEGMTPAHMNYTTGVFDYGSWENAFFMPKPCMLKYDGTVDYYLDPNDYSKKADGTASDVASMSYGGNAMMEWGQNGKKIWYKFVPGTNTDTSVNIYIADYQADNDFRCWNFTNSQNQVVDHFYTPIYNGSADSSNRLRSISGQQYADTLTIQQERTYAKNNGAGIWDIEQYCDIVLINILLVLMSKTLDSQTAYGMGMIYNGTQSTNEAFRTGVHNAKGLFYGTASADGSTYTNAVKVFGMENYWGLAWRAIVGLALVSGDLKYKLTAGTADGSSSSDYAMSTSETDFSGYLNSGTHVSATTSGIIQSQSYGTWIYTPKTFGSTSYPYNTYYCDYAPMNPSVSPAIIIRGGSSNNQSSNLATVPGAFALGGDRLSTWTNWNFNAAISCKPLG